MNSNSTIKLRLQSLSSSVFQEAPEHTTRTHTVRWVKVACFPSKRLQLGLSESGYWVREGMGDVCELDPKRGLVPLYPCLEFARAAFHQQLVKALSELGLPSELTATFPFNDLVEQSLQSGSEHWTKLGLQWVETASANERVERALEQVAQSQDKRLSQRTRQNAQRLIKVIARKCEEGRSR